MGVAGEGRIKKLASQVGTEHIPGIVKDLKTAPQDGKEKCAHLLDVLTSSLADGIPAMVRAGAVAPLVGMLASGTDGGQIHAASALASIAAARHDFAATIVSAGAVAPLVALVRSGSAKAQMHASAALAALSEDRTQQWPIIKAGAILPLVRLLRLGIDDVKIHAALCIANISAAHSEAQHAIHAAGATPLLLSMLQSGKSQMSAALALAKLLSPEIGSGHANFEIQEAIASEGGIAPLLALLNGVNLPAQVQAAAALSHLARGNERTQTLIARAGGISPLLAMLNSRSAEARACGAAALSALTCAHIENQVSAPPCPFLPLPPP